MRKYLLIAPVIFVLIIGFTVFYMSNYGLKTNKFNDLIYSKLEELNPKLKINLDQVFIKLNLTEQTVNIETLNPTLRIIEEKLLIKKITSKIKIPDLFQNRNSIENISISTEENKIEDLVNFIAIYDFNLGLFRRVSLRMTEYIKEFFELNEVDALTLQRDMYKKYGLTLTGLMREYKIDPDDYLDFIHDVTYPELKYEKQLQKSLNNLSGRKFIYTNASQSHAKKILSAMGLEAEFEKILDIKATQYVPKPDPKSYDIMLKSFGILSDQIENSIFIEDTAKNLKPAKLLGLKTVWMENERNIEDYKKNSEYVDYTYSDIKSFLKDIHNNN